MITAAALALVRRGGEESLSARSLGRELGCSSSPIFTVYDSMESIREDVRKAASAVFADYVKDCSKYTPAFKEFGIRLVRFSREEYYLYKMLFLTTENTFEHFLGPAGDVMGALVHGYDLSDDQAMMLINMVWTYTCGLATLCHFGAQNLTEQEISDRLSQQFIASIMLIKSGRSAAGVVPERRSGPDVSMTIDI